jgi:hypothetical protein
LVSGLLVWSALSVLRLRLGGARPYGSAWMSERRLRIIASAARDEVFECRPWFAWATGSSASLWALRLAGARVGSCAGWASPVTAATSPLWPINIAKIRWLRDPENKLDCVVDEWTYIRTTWCFLLTEIEKFLTRQYIKQLDSNVIYQRFSLRLETEYKEKLNAMS